MGTPAIEDIQTIRDRLETWDFLQQLPRTLQGFTWQAGGQLAGHELTLCSYVNEATHCRLDLIYTKETFDYMPVKVIGLQQYRDVRYITRDKVRFAEVMTRELPALLASLSPEAPQPAVDYILHRKGILDWAYAEKLPERIDDFELFIRPAHPVQYINNSIILIDYSDFAHGNQLVFLYNQVKNEFFAEDKNNFIPGTIHDFDCTTLKELEKLLDSQLRPYLAKLAAQHKTI